MWTVPKECFLTKGVGRHKEKLFSFEMALRDAHIAEYNLVRVSSIFPPACKILPKKQGVEKMRPGQIVHCVISECATNEPHRLLAASCGMAIPGDRDSHHGYISEHHAYGQKESDASDYAEDLAASMLATILGVDFDPDLSWKEKEEFWRISNDIYKTLNITQSAIGDKDGLWTTVIAAVVFVPTPLPPSLV